MASVLAPITASVSALLGAVLDDALDYWGFVSAAERAPATGAGSAALAAADATDGSNTAAFYDTVPPTLTSLAATPPTLPALFGALGGNNAEGHAEMAASMSDTGTPAAPPIAASGNAMISPPY